LPKGAHEVVDGQSVSGYNTREAKAFMKESGAKTGGSEMRVALGAEVRAGGEQERPGVARIL